MGDRPGHPFRGNQWNSHASGVGGGAVSVSKGDWDDRPAESDGVGTWRSDGTFKPDDTDKARAWHAQAGVAPGDAPVPFPVAEQGVWAGHRKIDAANPVAGARKVSTGMVPVDGLTATQHVVSAADIKDIIPRLREEMRTGNHTRKPATIVRMNGRSYIYNGHHRATAAKVGGLKRIHADVFEVN
jgi:hypothetical protein